MSGPLAQWELDCRVDRLQTIQGVRLGARERALLLRLASELDLPPARLARRLLVKGLLDIEEGRL